MEYVQKTWFDSLLDVYAGFEAPIDSRELYTTGSFAFTSDERHNAQTTIVTDLRLLFARSPSWFSFIHLPSFWTKFYSAQERASGSLQPGLVLSALALASFFRGSEIEGKTWQRERATRLKEEAEALVESSLAVGWIDLGLAQAAWVRIYLHRIQYGSPLVASSNVRDLSSSLSYAAKGPLFDHSAR
jgi:hypothetical protein